MAKNENLDVRPRLEWNQLDNNKPTDNIMFLLMDSKKPIQLLEKKYVYVRPGINNTCIFH